MMQMLSRVCSVRSLFQLVFLSMAGCGILSSSRTELSSEDHFRQGKQYLDERDYGKAITDLEIAVEADEEPFQEEAEFLLAEAYFMNRWYYQAYQRYKKFLVEYPLTPHLELIEEREFTMATELTKGMGRTFLGIHFREGKGLGVEILNHIIASFPTGKYGADARRLLAGYYFEHHDYEDALLEYQELSRNCPDSIWQTLADYRIGLCHLYQSRGYSYDRELLLKAKEEIENYLLFHPEGSHREEAKDRLKHINSLLAQKNLEIAEYYFSRGESFSAKIYLTHLMKEYPETPWAEKAKALLVQEERLLDQRERSPFSSEDAEANETKMKVE